MPQHKKAHGNYSYEITTRLKLFKITKIFMFCKLSLKK